ncbi:hypothetical protein LXA47_03735 [Massilia sp. P8910]|uniref:hypothetical protein n=1 Tax=Massilia antarctica TaxID=2765360 RepID=UPI001E369280|nr:hypothetical protein [Massilia antarctica]MCE3602710.1 hypothetical protein [Massilia antarctica]
MLNILESDLIVRLNEEKGTLQLLLPAKGGELQVLDEISESQFVEGESAADVIGKSIMSYLSASHTSVLFGLEDYREAGRDFAQSIQKESQLLLKSGDPDSEFEGVQLLLSEFDSKWTLADVDRISALLENAARGSSQAEKFLADDWPTRSDALKRRIARTRADP